MSDAPKFRIQEFRTQVRRWFVETGWVDGNGVGLWDGTDESVEVSSCGDAEALRDEWLASGKIERDQWGHLRRTGPYGNFRIRSAWQDISRTDLAAAAEALARIEGWNAAVEVVAARFDEAEAEDIRALRKDTP